MMKLLLPALLISLLCSCGGGETPTTPNSGSKANTAAGETLFKANCYQCHRPGAEGLGPNLAGARNRWTDKNELYAFIHNPQEVISRNKYARELQQQYKGSLMLPYPNLSKEEIDAILDYCDQAGNN